MIYLYRLNTGSCGGCDIEIEAAVAADDGLQWAATPFEADMLILTGPITHSCKAPLLRVLREVGDIPLLVVGRCAIDGHPFGKGGAQEMPDLPPYQKLEGCPPTPEAIANALRNQHQE